MTRNRDGNPEHTPLDQLLEDWANPAVDPVHAVAGEMPDASLLVALLRAGIQKDGGSIALLVHGVNGPALCALALGAASASLETLYGGVEQFDQALAHWQQTGRLPTPGYID